MAPLHLLVVAFLCIYRLNLFVICSGGRGNPHDVVIVDKLSDIPTLDGATELQQLTRFWQVLSSSSYQLEHSLEYLADKIGKPVLRAASTKYTVVPLHHKVSKGSFLRYTQNKDEQKTNIVLYNFDITETTDGVQPTSGGTTFTITTKGKPTSAGMTNSNDSAELHYTEGNCPYKDHFNGSYTVWCTIQDPVTEVVTSSMHTNFAAFNGKPAEKIEIMRRTLHYDGTLPEHPTNNWNCIHGIEPTWDYPVMYWLYRNNTSTWVKNGCALDFLSSEDVEQCYKGRFNNSFTVIGDSHLSYSFFYMVWLIDAPAVSALADKVEQDVDIGPYSLYWTTFMDTFTENIKRFMVNILQDVKKHRTQAGHASQTPHRHLLVIDAGTWDISHTGPHSMVQGFSHAVLGPLGTLQEFLEEHSIDITIIWQTMPSYPYFERSRNKWWRNTHLVGALNHWQCRQLEKVKIPCLDAWEITLAWQEKPECTNHMICARDGNITGHAGKAVVHKLLHSVCT